MIPSKSIIEALRKDYPRGCRVELVKMDDPQAPAIGTKGTVIRVDDIGSIMVNWDNGSCLNILYDEDECRKLTLRDNIIKAIFDNENNWSCPEYRCDMPEKEGNTGECCLKCAEKILKEYENKIKTDVIDEYIDIVLNGYTFDQLNRDALKFILNDAKNDLFKDQYTCFDCKHHFMSDCYLECNKHNRINNNQICEDFEHLKEQKNG